MQTTAPPARAGEQRPGAMSRRDRLLFHQIHPVKLAVDVAGGVVSTWLMYEHRWVAALLSTFPASIVATAALVRWAELERLRDSAFGRYVAHHMTATATATRSAGQIVAWIGAWLRSPALIVGGAAVIAIGWTYSLPRWLRRA
jgi:hypothetical protein